MLTLPTTPVEVRQRLAPLTAVPVDELLIHEIYRSIQGESTYAGLPCVFVRTSVCDLRCNWCDTPHAFNRGTRLTRSAVLAQVLAYDCPLVEVTGGEPLLQPPVLPLMRELADAGKTVLLETSGAHDIGPVDERVRLIMDLKCPDSGEAQRNHWPNIAKLKPTDEVKFVLASRGDWDWAEAIIRQHRLDSKCSVLISAVFGTVIAGDVVAWILASGLNVRFQLQLHKYIWDPKAIGV